MSVDTAASIHFSTIELLVVCGVVQGERTRHDIRSATAISFYRRESMVLEDKGGAGHRCDVMRCHQCVNSTTESVLKGDVGSKKKRRHVALSGHSIQSASRSDGCSACPRALPLQIVPPGFPSNSPTPCAAHAGSASVQGGWPQRRSHAQKISLWVRSR